MFGFCQQFLNPNKTTAAPKVMPPISLCWLTATEADVGAMAVEVEPSHQYSITFYCCVTDGSGGAVWQNGTWHGTVDEEKVWNWILPFRKKKHLLKSWYVSGYSTVTLWAMKQWTVSTPPHLLGPLPLPDSERAGGPLWCITLVSFS